MGYQFFLGNKRERIDPAMPRAFPGHPYPPAGSGIAVAALNGEWQFGLVTRIGIRESFLAIFADGRVSAGSDTLICTGRCHVVNERLHLNLNVRTANPRRDDDSCLWRANFNLHVTGAAATSEIFLSGYVVEDSKQSVFLSGLRLALND